MFREYRCFHHDITKVASSVGASVCQAFHWHSLTVTLSVGKRKGYVFTNGQIKDFHRSCSQSLKLDITCSVPKRVTVNQHPKLF